MKVLELKSLFHEDLSSHYSVDWLKAHDAHFSRERTLETADLTGVARRAVFGPTIYRPLKELGGPGMSAEPPKHRTNMARMRVAIPAQLRAVEKLTAAIQSETPCDSEVLLFAGMYGYLHAAGLLEPLMNEEPTPKKV